MKNYALDILNKCIHEIQNTSEKEFIENKKKMGLIEKTYNLDKYINDDIEIIMQNDEEIKFEHKTTEEFMTMRIEIEDEIIWSENFYHVEYEEASSISAFAA